MKTFLYALRAILPILLIIALGYGTCRLGHWNTAFFKQLNKLCFHLFLPINLFCNVYDVGSLAEINWILIFYLAAGILLALLLGILTVKLLVKERSQKGVLVQAAFRSNQAILGLPLASALGGEASMGFASLASALCVPIFNMLAVLCLTAYSGSLDQRPSARETVRKILTNPLIIGAVLGIAAVAGRSLMPEPIYILRDHLPSLYKALTMLSKVASPVMLFCLGACLDFQATGHLLPQLSLGIVLRLIVAPVLTIGLALLLRAPLGLTSVEVPSFVAVFASPVAVSSAVMVQEIGGDDQLASQLVVWTSVFSMGTIFLLIIALRTMGML